MNAVKMGANRRLNTFDGIQTQRHTHRQFAHFPVSNNDKNHANGRTAKHSTLLIHQKQHSSQAMHSKTGLTVCGLERQRLPNLYPLYCLLYALL